MKVKIDQLSWYSINNQGGFRLMTKSGMRLRIESLDVATKVMQLLFEKGLEGKIFEIEFTTIGVNDDELVLTKIEYVRDICVSDIL